MKNPTNKVSYFIVLLLGIIISFNSAAQNYYWVGDGGDWSDVTNHWSNVSGGAPGVHATPPGDGSKVIFDANSFSIPAQTVTYDVGSAVIGDMTWKTVSNSPTFVSSSANDSISIDGSMFLASGMTYNYGGKLFFTAGLKDTISTNGNTLLNNIYINTFDDTLVVKDNVVSTGGIILKRGGLFLNNRTITCSFFESSNGTVRELSMIGTTLNLTGSQNTFLVNEGSLTKGSTNEIININYAGSDTVELESYGGNITWSTLNINANNTLFNASSHFTTIQSTGKKYMGIKTGTILSCDNFNVNGSCGALLEIHGKGDFGVGKVNNLGTAWNLSFISLQNVTAVGATYNASNSIDFGGNTNWNITEDAGVTNYFWVGGRGDYHDPTHWALASNGAADLCIPGPNDVAIFDNNSGLDSLEIRKNVIIGSLDFQLVASSIVVHGNAENMEVRNNLSGSNFLQMDWDGDILMTKNSTTNSITSNGVNWNNDIIKTGVSVLSLVDDFANAKNLILLEGHVGSLGNKINVGGFLSDVPADLRSFDFTNSLISILDSGFMINTANLAFGTLLNSGIHFKSSGYSKFKTGGLNYDTVQVEKGNVEFYGALTPYKLLQIDAGASVILENGSVHNCDSLKMNGTCDELITIKSSNSAGPQAQIVKVANSTTTVNNVFLDHVNAGATGVYYALNSTLLNSSLNWISGGAINTVTLNFTSNVNIPAGDTLELTAMLPAFPAGATILSSQLKFTGINTTTGASINEGKIEVSGASTLAFESLTGAAGDATNVDTLLNTTTLNSASGMVTVKIAHDTVGLGPVYGTYDITTTTLEVVYLDSLITTGTKYYWYGDNGNWSDVNHWSFNSGNSPANPATCLPSLSDTVIFDANSFTVAGQTVTVDKETYTNVMDWSASTNAPTLLLDQTITFFDDVILDDEMTVTRNNQTSNFLFQPNGQLSEFDTDSTILKVPVVLLGKSLNDTLSLTNKLIMSDSTVIIIGAGIFRSNDFDMATGSFLIGSNELKKIELGSSQMNLVNGFLNEATAGLTFTAGTSNIIIDHGGKVSENYLKSNGLAFYDVQLLFNKDNSSAVTGSNSFNSLIVGKGSRLEITAGSSQTVANLLQMNGDCQDSIFLFSSIPSTSYDIIKATDSLQAQCLNITDADASGGAIFKTYFSTNTSNNTGFSFETDAAVTAQVSPVTNFCFGDTIQFTNQSTAFQNDAAGLSYSWYFGDSDTTFLTDTTQHEYKLPGNYQMILTAEYSNKCSDVDTVLVSIFAPTVSLNVSESDTTICDGDLISFMGSSSDTNITYQFIQNGTGIPAVPTSVYADLDLTNASNNDSISLHIFQYGCQAMSNGFTIKVNPNPVTVLTMEDSTICAGDSVVFTGSGGVDYSYFVEGVQIAAPMTGSFTYYGIVQDDSVFAISEFPLTGCTDSSAFIKLNVNDIPTVTLAQDDDNGTICDGDTVLFTATSATAVNYDFYLNNELVLSQATNTWSVDTLENGEFVNLIVTDINQCHSSVSNQFNYIVNDIPVPILSTSVPSLEICEGELVTFTSDNLSLYQFYQNSTPVTSLSGTSFYPTTNLLHEDTIRLHGTLNGCVGISAPLVYEVTSLPTTTLSAAGGNVICQNDVVDFTATSATATDYQFKLNGTSQTTLSSTNTYQNSTLQPNDIVAVDAYLNGCVYEDAITFVVNPSPNLNLLIDPSDLTICEEEFILLKGTGATNYEFYINNTGQGLGADEITTDNFNIGANSVYVRGVNTFACENISATETITVIEIPAVTLATTATLNTICAGENTTFTASNTADEFHFFLNGFSQGLPSADNTFSSGTILGGDEISVIGISSGCSNPSEDTITMIVNANPVADINGTTVFCEGLNEMYQATGGSTYEFVIDNNSNGTSAVDSYDGGSLPSGSHSILVNVFDNGCSSSASMNVSVLDNPTSTISGPALICSGDNAIYTSSGAGTYQFFINGNDQGPADVSNLFNSNVLIDGDIVSVVGISTSGCQSLNNASIAVQVNDTPTITLNSTSADNLLCEGEEVTFDVSGATEYEFFVNGFSVNGMTIDDVYITDSISNGQTIDVIGELNGCTNSSISYTYQVASYPVVGLLNNDDTTICVGENTDLMASGADEYLFQINGIPQGVFGASNVFNAALTDDDIVTVIGRTNSCETLADQAEHFRVYAYPSPNLTSSDNDNVICLGDTVTFSGTGAMTYEFYIDGLLVENSNDTAIVTNIENGETLTLVGLNGDCPTQAPETLVHVVNSMNLTSVVSPANYMLCNGESLNITMSGADEYEFFQNEISQGPQTANNSVSYSNLNHGDGIQVNGFNILTGCTQRWNETIYPTVFQEIDFSITDMTEFCEGDSVVFNSSLEHGNQWMLDGSPIVGATDSVYVAYTSGDYALQVNQGGNGELWSFGYNANGEFGNGNNFDSETPKVADVITDLSETKSGIGHVIALSNSGEVYTWGENASGQLGNATYTSTNIPVLNTGVPVAQSVSAGGNHSLVVTAAGDLFVWGENNNGQLGLGTTTVHNTPQLNPGVTSCLAVSSGISFSLVLKSDGTVWSSGNNDFGQLGTGDLISNQSFQQVLGLSNIVSITAGDFHCLAIDNTGKVFTWGNNSNGQLGLNDLNNRLIPELTYIESATDISGGNAHSLVSTSNGGVYVFGSNGFGQLGIVGNQDQLYPKLLNEVNAVDQVAAGKYHSVIKKVDGSVWGMGRNDNEQLGDLSTTNILNVTQLNGVEGVTNIDGGTECSHFIYGNNSSCASDETVITVNTAELPVIVLVGQTMITSTIGTEYQWYVDGIEIVNSNSNSIPVSTIGEYTVLVTFANGCTRLSNIFYHGVGIDELASHLYINAYPNPAISTFYVEWGTASVSSIRLFDVVGSLIWEENTTGKAKVELDVNSYAKGTYYVKVESVNGLTQVVKFVKN
jgi:alpha-tubulin suppressor-like RCC1 family protein